jgi:D-alanyl-D-alanine carboxypeptidase (penicillin-binding protein 5/6)
LYRLRIQTRPRYVLRRRRRPWAVLLLCLAALSLAWATVEGHPQPQASAHYITYAKPLMVQPAPRPLPNPPFPIPESSGALWVVDSHQLLWDKNPHLVLPLASTTKLMTAYLVLKHLNPETPVTISPEAAGTGGSEIFMQPGMTFTVRQLLYALLMASANDSAVALAQATSGQVSHFVAEMNATARAWGLTHLTFADPAGLSDQSQGTAWDLSVLAFKDLTSPLFRQIVATRRIALPHNPQVYNLNGLLFRDPSVIGLKTGWTNAAGFTVVFAATRQVDGHPVTLLGVLMHGQHGFPAVYRDAEALLNWGFAQVQANLPGTGQSPRA